MGIVRNKNKIKFSTKAKNLQNLKKVIKNAKILSQITFTVEEYKKNPKKIEKKIKNLDWDKIPVIIRSSAINEDQNNKSNAGAFLSCKNILGLKDIDIAIREVIKSFKDKNKKNEIFIQPFLNNLKCSGVIFTRDINNNAPYYKINYDDRSGYSDSITSGKSVLDKVFTCHRLYKGKLNKFQKSILDLCTELEDIFNFDSLDIEFVLTKNNTLYLLQVRPLIISHPKLIDDEEHYLTLKNINERIKPWFKKQPYLHGKKNIYGVMPDWNPAEIIGIKPKPLALSLYREVITNSIWAYQRDNYGYKNLRSNPLIVEIEGTPFIDVRVSFNSFIPKDLSDSISEKLVNYYLEKLRNNPELHDKIEFEIIYSCATFDTKKRLRDLKNSGFKKNEISKINECLISITNQIIDHKNGIWKEDYKKIKVLQERFEVITKSSLDDYAKIYWLIEDCKRYGTLPFAGLARAGFIAVEILKSMVRCKIITENDYTNFFESLDTISSKLVKDFNSLDKKVFIKKYGHLRPGTYDILSPTYLNQQTKYFNWNNRRKMKNKKKFKFKKEIYEKINIHLQDSGLSSNPENILNFIKEAIEAREFSKFMFTKNISKIIDIYGDVCRKFGIKIEDSAYTHIGSVMSLNSTISDPSKILNQSIKRRKERYNYTKLINLPSLICDSDDVFKFHEDQTKPNYITQKNVVADICFNLSNPKKIQNKIILIENADPGYDWIFSHNISGLVTKFGGANSHMAIRCSELNIPAAIGAGKLYDEIKKYNKIEINPVEKKIYLLKKEKI